MPQGKLCVPHRSLLALAVLLSILLPSTATAAGGPILSDAALWKNLSENQQIAVIRLGVGPDAQVDLFISLGDRTSQSHDITYFIPLGYRSAGFVVEEQEISAFAGALTDDLDETLTRAKQEVGSRDTRVLGGFAWSSLAVQGPAAAFQLQDKFVLPLLAGSSEPNVSPDTAFKTRNTSIQVYDVNTDAELTALISTGDMDPSVQQTLARLQGQQIAVLKLRTQPILPDARLSSSTTQTRQTGLHLRWQSSLVHDPGGASHYIYPLGAGQAWANPIALTQVYVVAEPGAHFDIRYPALGGEQSDYYLTWARAAYLNEKPIEPGFVVDDVHGDFGRIWRVTYLQSNSAEDIVVTRLPASTWSQAAVVRARARDVLAREAWIVGLVVGLAIWLGSWRLLMPGLLGSGYSARGGRLFVEAFGWELLFPLTSALSIVGLVWLMYWLSTTVDSLGAPLRALMDNALPFLATLVLFSYWPNPLLFALFRAPRLDVSRRRAFASYLLVVLVATVLYILFAFAYYRLVTTL